MAVPRDASKTVTNDAASILDNVAHALVMLLNMDEREAGTEKVPRDVRCISALNPQIYSAV